MKTIFTKHKVLLIALCGVLCLGVLSGLVLTGVIKISKEGKTFATVAEAKEAENTENQSGDQTETVQEIKQKLQDINLGIGMTLTDDIKNEVTRRIAAEQIPNKED